MKKLFMLLMLAAMSAGISATAQRAGEYNLVHSDDWNHSGIFANVGLGVACGDVDTDLGLSVGLGYRYHFGNGLNWDVISATYYSPMVTDDFEDSSSLRILTGIRYNSSPILAGKPLYGNFAAGYQMNLKDFDYWHGFAYELGAGVLLSRTVSLGLMWEGNVAHYDLGYDESENLHFGIFGVKLGLNF